MGSARLVLIPFSVYCFVYPFAILLMSFDWMPFGMEWMSSLLLAMLGLTSLGWLWANLGRLGLVLGALIFGSGIALEYLGVLTGFPFGNYRYTGVLTPELPGSVPLAIGFAWLLVIVSGLFTARRFFSGSVKSARNTLALALGGATLAVVLDLLLEPVAYHVKSYWQWIPGDGAYYGIPVSNFVAWFVAALLLNLLLASVWKRQSAVFLPWLPIALFVMNVIMFGIVDVAHGFWIAGVIGLVTLLGLFALKSSRAS
jgi:putative membrane protein